MDNTKNKNLVWGIVIVVIIILLAVWAFKKPMTDDATGSSRDTTATVDPESTQDVADLAPATVGAASISYANALVKYADRRIQLDKICQATPNTVTYKDNTGVMIDNRSAVTRTVKVGTTFTIKPYGFKIVTLPDTYLQNKTLLVDCDASQNVATILVQE